MQDVLNRQMAKQWIEKAEKCGWLSDYEFASLMRTLLSEEDAQPETLGERMRLNGRLAVGLSKTIGYNPGMWELFDYVPEDEDEQ